MILDKLDAICSDILTVTDELVRAYGSLSDWERHFVHDVCAQTSQRSWQIVSGLCDGADATSAENSIRFLIVLSLIKSCQMVADAEAGEHVREMETIDLIVSRLQSYILIEGTEFTRAFHHGDSLRNFITSISKKYDIQPFTGAIICGAVDASTGGDLFDRLFTCFLTANTAIAEHGGISDAESEILSKLQHAFHDVYDTVYKTIVGKDEEQFDSGSKPLGELVQSVATEFKNVQRELEGLVGLPEVKVQLKKLVAHLAAKRGRNSENAAPLVFTNHFVFAGNPGSGKATVAGLLARILNAYGLLQRPEVIVCSGSELAEISKDQQGKSRFESLLADAIGAILYIEDASAILGSESQLSSQAKLELLANKIEETGQQVIFVIAGAENEVKRFVRSDQRLMRFFTKFVTFSDFRENELCQIFEQFCSLRDLHLSPEAKARISLLMHFHCLSKSDDFDNGLLALRAFEDARKRHAIRTARANTVSMEKDSTLSGEDISFQVLPCLVELDVDINAIRWSASCPGCETDVEANSNQLGEVINCSECNESFYCQWGAVVPESINRMAR